MKTTKKGCTNMTKFGVEQELYYCPKIRLNVILELYYNIYKKEKIYSSVSCDTQTECGYKENDVVTESCPAYRFYIERREAHSLENNSW